MMITDRAYITNEYLYKNNNNNLIAANALKRKF
jgi:hypothetical protein